MEVRSLPRVLRPLDDCLTDSPWFRQNLHEHECELEDAHKNIKNIEAQCREIIQCSRKLSAAQRSFANSLKDFKFITIGSTQTDDERKLAECLSKFGEFIVQVEEHRQKIVEDSEVHYIEPLRKFRVDGIGKVLHDDKKKYEKESNKFYASLEKHLHLSTARRNDFKEADAQLDMQQRNFCKCSLDYVTAIQAVQERMKFEFVETVSSFLYSWLTFYHVGHVIHEDFKPYLGEVQSRVQKAKQSFDETKEHYVNLKEKMLASHLKNAVFQSGNGKGPNENTPPRPVSSIKQGYVYVQEKSKLPKTIGRDVLSNRWTKYYCVYQKETLIFTMIPVNSTAKAGIKGALGQSVSFKLKSCTRRASDSIDKRFCFDVLAMDRTESITVQALSEEDRRQWLDAMDGREPIYSPGTGPPTNSFGTMLDDAGFDFIKKCLEAIEEKGLREQGLYRNCGVTSKVQKLMQIGLDKRRGSNEKLNFTDDSEWETKTLSSAVKTFLRNLPEPLMTFDLHNQFINAAKMDSKMRVSHIHYYVYQLPKIHIDMLRIIVEHLRKVADCSNENLMTVGNLGVCFGPTLLRPKEETMAAIMDIKFCNVVVEVLISSCDLIFNTRPSSIDGIPCPPKPLHRSGASQLGSTALLEAPISAPPKYASASPPELERRLASDGEALSGRPRSIGSAGRQRPPPPHIYDRVATSYADSNDEGSATSPRLASAYGKASTSTSTTPVSPGGVGMVAVGGAVSNQPTSAQKPEPAARRQPGAHFGGVPTRTRRIRDGEVGGESSDSLNSMASGSDASPSPNGCQAANRGEPPADSGDLTVASSTKAKMSTSYAPAYNPFACESRRVKTLYACTAGHDTELSFQPGQIITNVYESKEEGWLVGTLNGKTGLIPANYVEPLP